MCKSPFALLGDKMSDWVECYGDRAKTRQRFACRKCDTVVDAGHNEGPPNGICTCGCTHFGASEAYRAGYDLIKWDRNGKEKES